MNPKDHSKTVTISTHLVARSANSPHSRAIVSLARKAGGTGDYGPVGPWLEIDLSEEDVQAIQPYTFTAGGNNSPIMSKNGGVWNFAWPNHRANEEATAYHNAWEMARPHQRSRWGDPPPIVLQVPLRLAEILGL